MVRTLGRAAVPPDMHKEVPLPATDLIADCDPANQRRVLIVDESTESREVLRTVLERRGLQILEARGARQGLELARSHHPEVIVLDLDTDAAEDTDIQAGFNSESRTHHSSLLVLGKARQYGTPLPDDRVLTKPYHYAPLVRKIEQLIGEVVWNDGLAVCDSRT